jgi:signal transduction histidine kinase
MMTVINDILDFAKIEAKKLKLDPAEFNLPECVGEALKLSRLRPIKRDWSIRAPSALTFPRRWWAIATDCVRSC